jgi:hypothetical protein
VKPEDWHALKVEHRQHPEDARRCAAAGCRERWPCVYRLQAEAALRGSDAVAA